MHFHLTFSSPRSGISDRDSMFHDSVTSSAEQLSCKSFGSVSPRKKGMRSSSFKSGAEERPTDVTMTMGYEEQDSFCAQLGGEAGGMDSSFMTADEGASSPPSSQQLSQQGNGRSTRASSKRQKQTTTLGAAKACLDEATINALLGLQQPRNVQFVQ